MIQKVTKKIKQEKTFPAHAQRVARFSCVPTALLISLAFQFSVYESQPLASGKAAEEAGLARGAGIALFAYVRWLQAGRANNAARAYTCFAA